MGWEEGPEIILEWVSSALDLDENLEIIIYWNKDQIDTILLNNRVDVNRITVIWSEKDITDDEAATERDLLRKIAWWKKSSLNKWILDLGGNELDGFLTAWNTASAVLLARRSLFSWDRQEAHTPISIWFPRIDLSDALTPQKEVMFLDAWGHVDDTMYDLMTNHQLAADYFRKFRWIRDPKYKLWNIWVEGYKWDEAYKEAYGYFDTYDNDRFLWNIEPNRIFNDTEPDFIVAWWTFWNTVLKTAEWVFWTIEMLIRQWVFPTGLSKARAPFTARKIKRQLSRLDPNNTPDGKILWLDKLKDTQSMSKLHGNVNAKWVKNWILRVAWDIRQSKITEEAL